MAVGSSIRLALLISLGEAVNTARVEKTRLEGLRFVGTVLRHLRKPGVRFVSSGCPVPER